MPFAREFLKHMAHPGLRPHQGVARDAQALGDGVGGLEADAVDIEGQAVGVLAHLLDGLVAVGLVDAHGARGADPVGLEKHHDLADDLLLGPGAGDPLLALGADALEFPQPFGVLLDDLEHRLAKGLDQLLREVRPDALDHARAQVLLDAVEGARRNDAQLPAT